MTDHDLLMAFLQFKEVVQGRRPGTIDAYRSRLERLISFLDQSGKSLCSSSYDDLAQFAAFHLHGLGVTPRSRRPTVAAIRELFKWLMHAGYIRANPAQGLQPPRFGRPLPEFMTMEMFEAIFSQIPLDTLAGLRDAAITAMLMGAGLRVSGVIGLNEGNLFTERDKNGQEKGFVKVLEKGKVERIVPVADGVWLTIQAYRGMLRDYQADRWTDGGDKVLFISLRNRRQPACELRGDRLRLTAGGIRKILRNYAKSAGVDLRRVHPHALRHGFGVQLAEHGADIAVRQMLLGHAKPETTRIYDHLATGKMREYIERASPFEHIQSPFSDLVRQLRSHARPSS